MNVQGHEATMTTDQSGKCMFDFTEYGAEMCRLPVPLDRIDAKPAPRLKYSKLARSIPVSEPEPSRWSADAPYGTNINSLVLQPS
ncbi:MAG: hypothetical protein AABX62_03470 [Thermoproteota archaeon]